MRNVYYQQNTMLIYLNMKIKFRYRPGLNFLPTLRTIIFTTSMRLIKKKKKNELQMAVHMHKNNYRKSNQELDLILCFY